MLVVSIVIDSSVASYFQRYIHIRPFAVYIVGIEDFFASAFKNMAFAAQLTSSSSFLQGLVKRAFLCSCFVRRLVDFFATWCQPCKIMHPILEQVKEMLGERIRIIKIDVDKYGVTANRYGKP